MEFAANRSSSDWAKFRDHYPRCPECSRAVAELGELTARLARHGETTRHLTDEQLLALQSGEPLGSEAAAVEMHLAGCFTCRTELAVLGSFDPEARPTPHAAEAVRADAHVVPDPAAGWINGLPDFFASLLRPGPVLGFAAAVALAVFALWTLSRPDVAPLEQPHYVERPTPRAEPAPAPDTGLARPEDELLAEGVTPLPPGPVDEQTLPAPPAPGPRLAESTPHDDTIDQALPDVPGGDPDEPGESADEREVMVLAALLPSELPQYVGPFGVSGDGLLMLRSGGSLRSAGGPRPQLSVLAPEHLGVTRQASPRLYWVLDRSIEGPLEVIVSDPNADDPLLEKRVAGPFTAGIHAIDLAREGVTLSEGRDYEWSVALPADGLSRQSDLVSLGGIRRATSPDSADAADTAARAGRVHRLATEGYWYDAFDQANRWIEAAPEVDRIVGYRRALLEQVALDAVIPWIDTTRSTRE